MHISVDCSSTASPLQPFWGSTGFTPGTLLLTDDMRQQITYCGSIPRGGLRFARAHYLLELVEATFDGENATHYEWSRLDAALDLLAQNGMAPIFELMGNPSGLFDDFNDDLQLRRWRNLVRDLANHCIVRYGKEQVQGWYFESWNEPDGGFGWQHQWPQDEASFCSYYDACVEGLRQADPALVIGGPGTCQTLSSLFRAFLAHCDSGINYFSGQAGTRLDFISIHEKGARPHREDLTPRTRGLIEREQRIIAYIRANHLRLADTPFMNNECDPQVGWKDTHTWHARPYYAAWACRSVVEHLENLVDGMGVHYPVLSNDHGFIGDWGNRTLLARFGRGDWIEDGQGGHASKQAWQQRDFTTPRFAMVKKPIFNAMTLLSLLGDQRLSFVTTGGPDPEGEYTVSVLPTLASPDVVAMLVSYTCDMIQTSGSLPIRLHLENLPFGQFALAHYQIAHGFGDPFLLWEAAGAPDLPDENLLHAMRGTQEPHLLRPPKAYTARRLDLSLNLPLHSASLILLHARPDGLPAPVTHLRADTYLGLHGTAEHLLRWDPLPSRAIASYEILHASQPGEFPRQLFTPNLINSAWMSSQGGFYQVRARDWWGRLGQPSEVVQVP